MEPGAAAGVGVLDAGWHLRSDDPPVVVGEGPVLQPLALVCLRRDVDAHRAAIVVSRQPYFR